MEHEEKRHLRCVFRENEYSWFYRLMITLGMILFYSLYIDKVFPASEGWHITYVELMKAGQMPYRDFYYYLPPLDLFVSSLLWTLSSGSYLIYRCLRIFERIIVAQLVYTLLRKQTKPLYAGIASMFGGIMYSACVYDLGGDYNQTGLLLMALLAMAAQRFVNVKTANGKKYSALLTGGVLGLLFLSKQTYFLAAFLAFFAGLSYLCLINRDRDYGWYILFAAIGVLLVLALLYIWLIANGAFLPFVEQVFLNVDSKGSLVSLIFGSAVRLYSDRNTFSFLLFLLPTCALAHHLGKIRSGRKAVAVLLGMGVLATVLCTIRLANTYQTSIHILVSEFNKRGMLTLTSIFVPGICCVWVQHANVRGKLKGVKGELLLGASCVALVAAYVVLLSINPHSVAERLYKDEGVYANFCAILHRTVNTSLLIILLYMVWACRKEDEQSRQWFFLILITFACGYAQQMAVGTSMIGPYYLILALPVLLAYLMSRSGRFAAVRNGVLIGICFAAVLITSAQKAVSSYRWWGWQETAIQEHNYSIDVEGLEGFKVTQETKRLYEEITKLVEKNTESDSSVLGYPHNVIFNQLANRSNLGRFVPVYFYDVAARKYVSEDVAHLKENQPDLVIWQDIPGCYDTHESVFNQSDKRMAQYELEEWFAFAKDSDYTLVGKVGNVFVYKLNDNGIPIGYTYIEDDAPNTTASVAGRFYNSKYVTMLEEEMAAQFAGCGTESDPFQIAEAEDLLHLAEAVKRGVSFENQYFAQTADIEFSHLKDWTPIGEYGSDNCFRGVYDGKGHVIRGIRCKKEQEDSRVGLFGVLGGDVINLGIEDSSFSADNVGVICADAIGMPYIMNCYTRNVQIKAQRAAGIALNIADGAIYNCWSSNQIQAQEAFGIVPYATTMGNSYSFDESPAQCNMWQSMNSQIHLVDDSAESVERVCTYLNDWIDEKRMLRLKYWNMADGNLGFE